MEKQVKKKITWVIKNFSSLESFKIRSDHFIIDGCRWYLSAYPKPKGLFFGNCLHLYLEVANNKTLPSEWRRRAKVTFTIVNQLSEKLSRKSEHEACFDSTFPARVFRSLIPQNELHAKNSGFLVNGELKIVAEVDVLEVIGNLDVSEEEEEESTIIETMDVNGFQLLPSQVKSVSYMFERHPDIASEFHLKNPNLRSAYMSVLLSLIETICQSPQELSNNDMSEAYATLDALTNIGFKLDWLAKKLDDVSEKKKKTVIGETRLQRLEEELKDLKQKHYEMEKELKDMKQKCSEMEALVEKEKREVLAAKSPLLFGDVV